MEDPENSLEVAINSSEPVSASNEFPEAPRKVPESIEQALASVEQALENVREALGTNGKNEDNGVHENGLVEDNFEDILSKAVDEAITNGHPEPEELTNDSKQRKRKVKKIIMPDGSIEEVSCDESDEETEIVQRQFVELDAPESNPPSETFNETQNESEAVFSDLSQVTEKQSIPKEVDAEETLLESNEDPEITAVQGEGATEAEVVDEPKDEAPIETVTDALDVVKEDVLVEDAKIETTEESETSEDHLEEEPEAEVSNQIPEEEVEVAKCDEIEATVEDTEITVDHSGKTDNALETESDAEMKEAITEDAEVETIEATEGSEITIDHKEEETITSIEEPEAKESNQIPEEEVEAAKFDEIEATAEDTKITVDGSDKPDGVIETESDVEMKEEITEEKKLESVSEQIIEEDSECQAQPSVVLETIESSGNTGASDEPIVEVSGSTLNVEVVHEVKESAQTAEDTQLDGNVSETNISTLEADSKLELNETPEHVENETIVQPTLEDSEPVKTHENIECTEKVSNLEEETVEIPVEVAPSTETDPEASTIPLATDPTIERVENIEPTKEEFSAGTEDLEPVVSQEEAIQIIEAIQVQSTENTLQSPLSLEADKITEEEPISEEKDVEPEPTNQILDVIEDKDVTKSDAVESKPIIESSEVTIGEDNKKSEDEIQTDSDKLTLLVSEVSTSNNEEESIKTPEKSEPETQDVTKQNEDDPRTNNFDEEKQVDPETSNLETEMVVSLQETIADLEKDDNESQSPQAVEKTNPKVEPQPEQKPEIEKKLPESPPKSIREQYKAANAPKPEAPKSSCILS